MAPKTKFAEGEKILCFHGPMIYEAKVQKVEIKGKEVRYFVHYSGWNKNWDEWVPEARVLKYNDTSLQKQKELKNSQNGNKKLSRTPNIGTPRGGGGPGKGDTPGSTSRGDRDKDSASRSSTPTVDKQPSTKDSSSQEGSRRKRAKLDATIESEDQYVSKVEVKVAIPDGLKAWLVDDWDLVTRQKQLVSLPAKPTIQQLLADYVLAKASGKDKGCKDTVSEVAQGLGDYFNIMLGTQLLYKFERPQYAEILQQYSDLSMLQIYGAVHFLRLFVKIGNMLSYTSLDEKGIQTIVEHIHDFLQWMNANVATLFQAKDYFIAPPEYHRKAV